MDLGLGLGRKAALQPLLKLVQKKYGRRTGARFSHVLDPPSSDNFLDPTLQCVYIPNNTITFPGIFVDCISHKYLTIHGSNDMLNYQTMVQSDYIYGPIHTKRLRKRNFPLLFYVAGCE